MDRKNITRSIDPSFSLLQALITRVWCLKYDTQFLKRLARSLDEPFPNNKYFECDPAAVYNVLCPNC